MSSGPIYTIGHGSTSTAALIERLRGVRVQFLIDVRSIPYSKFQPEFSREPLQRMLADAGLRYVFMGDHLGGRPKDETCYTDGRVDYTKTRTKDFFQHGIDRLRNAVRQGFTVCLICSEARPSQCHRSKLIAPVLIDGGIEVSHLLLDGRTQTQEDAMREIDRGQPSLFEEQLRSRKVYR